MPNRPTLPFSKDGFCHWEAYYRFTGSDESVWKERSSDNPPDRTHLHPSDKIKHGWIRYHVVGAVWKAMIQPRWRITDMQEQHDPSEHSFRSAFVSSASWIIYLIWSCRFSTSEMCDMKYRIQSKWARVEVRWNDMVIPSLLMWSTLWRAAGLESLLRNR